MTKIIITKYVDGNPTLKFWIMNPLRYSVNIDTNVTSLPMPASSDTDSQGFSQAEAVEETILYALGGVTGDISLDAEIIDTSTDVSLGTASASTYNPAGDGTWTAYAQLNYLMKEFLVSDVSVSFTIQLPVHTFSCIVRSISFTDAGDDPNKIGTNFKFVIGKGVTQL